MYRYDAKIIVALKHKLEIVQQSDGQSYRSKIFLLDNLGFGNKVNEGKAVKWWR